MQLQSTDQAEPSQSPASSWHAVSPAAAIESFASSDRGLTEADVVARRQRHGANVLPRRKRTSNAAMLLRQINNPIVLLLIAAATVAIVLGKVLDGAIVLGAVAVNAAFGFIQERRAGKAIEALALMVPQITRVVRDGRELSIGAEELVPGDIVLLASGDSVPADLRILAAKNLRIEEAALTGESVPSSKREDAVAEGAEIGDRSSMAFGGTIVTSGTARGLVVAIGGETQLGQISHLLETTTELQTPLTVAIARVGKSLTFVLLGVSAVLVLIASLRGYSLADSALVAVTLAVASIPEGLPAIITIILAVGVQRMGARRAIVRRLPSVETLGSTTTICSDKTGTLTRNQMTVQSLVSSSGMYHLSGVGYAPHGALSSPAGPVSEPPSDVMELVRAGALCSDATLRHDASAWVVDGDPTEGALVVAAAKLGVNVDELRGALPRLDVIPFESEHQFMATLHARPDGSRLVILKGAPEVVLERVDLPGAQRDAAMHQAAELASRALRVLAVAQRVMPGDQASIEAGDVTSGFTLLGLEGMIDPPRPEAIAAIQTCQAAGITVKMITGDHLGTAVAIGKELGLLAAEKGGVRGAELERADSGELQRLAVDRNVFARVAPEHKLALVQALQREGHVVAMTGDGVNDAPALKQANIGIAMGITGTAVSKEAADIVLADDNFATIAAAVEEGRRIYDNLVKSLAFVLPTNLGLGLILVTAVAAFPVLEVDGASVPLLPMLPSQLLWVNLVTSVTLSFPLAFERLEVDAMRRPPRSSREPLIGRFIIVRWIVVAILMAAGSVGLFWWEYWTQVPRHGHMIALREAQTMAVTTVVCFQIFYLFNCRSLQRSLRTLGVFSNPRVFVGVGLLVVLQGCFIYVPFMQTVFGTAALQPLAIVFAIAAAAVVLPAITIEKAVRTRRSRRVQRRSTVDGSRDGHLPAPREERQTARSSR